MQIQPILGYFWAILGLNQPPGPPPLWISTPPFFYISWIRPWELGTNCSSDSEAAFVLYVEIKSLCLISA